MKSLNIYLASTFKNDKLCEEIRIQLLAEGHNVPDVWWNVKTKEDFVNRSEEEFYSSPLIQSIAMRHWKTIDTIDAVVLVSDENNNSFNGANVEVGYAIAKGIPVFSIGQLKRSAMYVPIIKTFNTVELIRCLNVLALEER